jgi:hypothetical protein
VVGLHQVEEDRTPGGWGSPVCPARSLAGPAWSDAHASMLPPGGKPNQQSKNRKIQFMKALSENLDFRNLDNDAGVFHFLLDAAEEEVTEAVLAYHFLRTAARPLTAAELDRRISRTGSPGGGRPPSTSKAMTGWASCAGCGWSTTADRDG